MLGAPKRLRRRSGSYAAQRSAGSNDADKPLFIKKRAGDGNRTRVASLENSNSTIELHPQKVNCLPR